MSTVIPLDKIRKLVTKNYPGPSSDKNTKEPRSDAIIVTVESAIDEQSTAIENLGNATKGLNHMIGEIESVRDALIAYLGYQIAFDYLCWLRTDKRTHSGWSLFNSWCDVHSCDAVRELRAVAGEALKECCPEVLNPQLKPHGMEILPAILDDGINVVDHRLAILSGAIAPDPVPDAPTPVATGDVPAYSNGLAG